jgi:xanthine dehydrogenase accessory factor
MAWEVGLACGGRVQVYVERVAHWLLEAVLAARAAGAPVAVVMHLDSGEQAILFAEGGEQGELVLAEEIIRDVRRAIAADRSQSLDTPAGRLFICVFTPPPRLVIVGAVHIAEPLTVIGQLAGYAVTIIDPRQAFAARDRFAGVTMASGWPDDALVRIEPDERTAVVTLTHDPKLDDAALAVALRSPAFYIGALGSRKSQAARQDRLAKLGFSEGERARVCGPVGLAIGAETPAEIAIAIMAEITQKRRSGRSA